MAVPDGYRCCEGLQRQAELLAQDRERGAQRTRVAVRNLERKAQAEAARAEQPLGSALGEDAWLLLAASAMAKDAGNVTLDVNGEAVQRALYRTLRANDLKEPVKVTNTGDTEVRAVVTV